MLQICLGFLGHTLSVLGSIGSTVWFNMYDFGSLRKFHLLSLDSWDQSQQNILLNSNFEWYICICQELLKCIRSFVALIWLDGQQAIILAL